MPGVLIKTIARTASNGLHPIATRALHRLSTGDLVAVIFDSNSTLSTIDGGDNTNIAKFYVYTSSTGEVWTLRATVTTDVAGTDAIDYSSCVDALNNLHLAWASHAHNLGYLKLTYAVGPTYTAGTTRTLYTATAPYRTTRVDIDSLGNSTDDVVVAAYTTNLSNQTTIRLFHQSGGGTVNHALTNIVLGGVPKTDTDYLSVAGCKDAIVSNVATFAILSNQAFAKDLGERLNIFQINTSTGAQLLSATTYTLPTAGKAAGLRQWTMICPDNAPRTFFVTGVFGDQPTGTIAAWKFTVNSGVTRTDVVPLVTTKMPVGSHSAGYTPGWRFGNAAYDGGNKCLLLFTGTNYAYSCSVDFSSGIAKFRSVPYTFDGLGYTIAGNAITTVSSGGSRNCTPLEMGCLVFYARAQYQVRYLGLAIPAKPINVSPSGAQVVTTDRPIFTAQFKDDYNAPQTDRQIEWQVASDSAFTTNLKTLIDDVKTRPMNTHTGGATIVATQQMDAAQEMFQGLWYIRSLVFDEMGNFSPASATDTFQISHPPVANNLAPNAGAVALYGTGSVQLQWTFTDPSPFDFQTAYEIFVSDVDGNTIFDSGKVLSANPVGVATIPVGNKDQLLRWWVVLWDSDDVTGPPSAPQTFIVSDQPVPAITSPTTGAVLAAVPNVTWTQGIAAAKVQQSWRMVIKQATTTVYDTGYVADSTTASLQVPNGIMHNGLAYTITVYVRDNLGLEGSSTIAVTTSWAAPAAPTTNVYLFEFDRKGFIFLGWTNALVDTNFVQWNIYRRQIGDTAWTLLGVVTDYSPTYGYRDYTAKAATSYQYVVTQTSNSTGDLVESTHNTFKQVRTSASRYWLMDPFGLLDAVPLFIVTAENYTDETESTVITLLGRGRHRDKGTKLGPNGSMTISMRDKYVGIDAGENLFYDPAIQMHTVGNDPDQWTMASAGTVGNRTNDYQTFFEPAPDGKLSNFVYRADAFNGTTADRIALTQTIDSVRLVGIAAQANKFKHAWWVAPESDPANTGTLVYNSHAEYYNASNTLIGTEDVALTQVDTYEPTTSGDTNIGNWKRVSAQHTMTAGTDHIIISLRVSNSIVGQNGVILGGASIFAGTVDKPYFDGDFNGAIWNAGQFISTSVSAGLYPAREQRQDIFGMRDAGNSAFVRNPFGDMWSISLADPKFTRLAGTTGESELGDLQLDYVQVAD